MPSSLIGLHVFRFGGLILAPLLALTATSCGPSKEDRKPVFPVKGQVFVKDKPAVGAEVLLVPGNEPAEPKDPRPRATVGQDGSFTLSTYGADDGAPAGDYVVTIIWPGGVTPDGREEPEDKLFGQYADPNTSRLRATVKAEPTELPAFRLK